MMSNNLSQSNSDVSLNSIAGCKGQKSANRTQRSFEEGDGDASRTLFSDTNNNHEQKDMAKIVDGFDIKESWASKNKIRLADLKPLCLTCVELEQQIQEWLHHDLEVDLEPIRVEMANIKQGIQESSPLYHDLDVHLEPIRDVDAKIEQLIQEFSSIYHYIDAHPVDSLFLMPEKEELSRLYQDLDVHLEPIRVVEAEIERLIQEFSRLHYERPAKEPPDLASEKNNDASLSRKRQLPDDHDGDALYERFKNNDVQPDHAVQDLSHNDDSCTVAVLHDNETSRINEDDVAAFPLVKTASKVRIDALLENRILSKHPPKKAAKTCASIGMASVVDDSGSDVTSSYAFGAECPCTTEDDGSMATLVSHLKAQILASAPTTRGSSTLTTGSPLASKANSVSSSLSLVHQQQAEARARRKVNRQMELAMISEIQTAPSSEIEKIEETFRELRDEIENQENVRFIVYKLAHYTIPVENEAIIDLIGELEDSGVQALMDALRRYSSSACILSDGCTALGNLANNCDNRLVIVSKGGIELAIHAMTTFKNDEWLQDAGCFLLGKLAWNNANRDAIAARGGIELIVDAMKHFTREQLQRNGCFVLGNMAVNEVIGMIIAREHGIQRILWAMARYSFSECLQDCGCFALKNLTKGIESILLSHNGLWLVIKALTRFSDHSQLQRNGCSLLRQMAVNDSVRQAIVGLGGAGFLKEGATKPNSERRNLSGSVGFQNFSVAYKNDIARRNMTARESSFDFSRRYLELSWAVVGEESLLAKVTLSGKQTMHQHATLALETLFSQPYPNF